jgi:hypothetical protein
MFQFEKWSKFIALFVVSGVTILAYHALKKPHVIDVDVAENPSYKHSLKIGNKVLRTYRSPAAAEKLEREKRTSDSGNSSGNSGDSELLNSIPSSDSESIKESERYADHDSDSSYARSSRSENSSTSDTSSSGKKSAAQEGAKSKSLGITGTQFPYRTSPTSPTTPTTPTTADGSSTSSGVGSTPAAKPVIQGKVKPLVGIVAKSDNFPFIETAYAANSCTNPRIFLFDLTNMSVLLDNPLTEKHISGETSFTFDPAQLGLSLSKPSRYLLHTYGCTTNYKRIVTSFYEAQDLDFITTLVSNIINTASGNSVTTAAPGSIQNLYESVAASAGTTTDYNDLYDMIDQTPSLSTIFEEAFNGGSPSDLVEAAPDMNEITYSTTLNEKSSYLYEADASHWNSLYQIAQEWQINGVTVSTTASWNYVPTANSPETEVITLIIGKKNLIDSFVDRTVPYHEVSWDISVNDSFPVQAPIITFDPGVTNPSSTRNISFDISTGVDCETFSNFAITENGVVPGATDFTEDCSAPVLNYSLNEPTDGPVNVNFWSRDIAGKISSAATLNIEIDSTAPVMQFENLQASYAAENNHTFEWKLTETHSDSSQNFTVELFDGTSWSSVGTVPVTDGPHNGTVFTDSIALPNINVANAKVRVTYEDTLGQQTVIESAAFAINRPQLGSSPATIDLGSVLNKNLSSGTAFTFTNTGLVASKSCSAPVITGANASEFSLTTDGCNGSSIASAGSCSMVVKGNPQAKGTRTGTITITCGNDSYSTSLTIDSLNNTPVIANTSASTLEDTAVYVTLGGIADVDGDSLTYSFPAGPSSGVLDNCHVNATNYECRYTPNADFTGTDTFTFKSNDGTVDSATKTATITVLPLNDAPALAGALSLTTNEDTALNFNLVAGSDVDGDTISYVITSAPTHGALVCAIATSVACTYTPELNYNGADSFTYRVTDGVLNSGTITVPITINPVNDAPMVAADQTLSTRDNFAYDFTITTGNDVDTANGSLTYKLISGPASGALTNCISAGVYSADRTCTYTAPLNFDGPVTLSYLVYDGALESTSTATVTINVTDQTATTPNLTPVNFVPTVTTPNSPLTLTAANCTDIGFIKIQESSTAPAAGAAGWQACSTVAAAMLFDPSVSNAQGFRTLRVYGKDPKDNISAPQLINFIFDSLPPQISIEAIPTMPNNIAYPLKWRLTEASILAAATFKLEYSLDGGSTWTIEANVPVGQDGPHASTLFTYNWNVPAGTYPNSQYRISLTDSTSLATTELSNPFRILVDLNAPNLLAGQMKINGSAAPAPTPQKYVNVSLKSLDGDTNITHFCLKIENTPPAGNDACWRAVNAPQPGLTPSETLDLVNFPFLLGFVPGIYNVYAWTRDLSGNISNNTGTTGQDVVSVEYFSDTPPVISNFFVSNTVTPPNPITGSEMTFDSGNPVHIKWTAVDDKGIRPTLTLYYTLDDLTWSEITNGLSNGQNNCSNLDEGGTSLDDDSTGCYQWTSPVANTQYFKVQLIIEDTAFQATSVTSVPLNSNRFKVLAGNIDPGVNSSAKSAIIATAGAPSFHSLAVASDGKVFLRDASFGLMYINPRTGVYEQLLSVSGTSAGDNGPVKSATARAVYKIAMDYQDRLIIWDYDRIRRVDTRNEPMIIETIMGAQNNGPAGTQTTDTVTDPADLRVFPGPGDAVTLQPLPNGDIYIQSGPFGTVDGGNTLRIYRGSLPSPSISSIRISGSGTADDYGGPLSMTADTMVGYSLDFDANTSVVSKIMAKLQRYPIGCSFFSMANIDPTTYVSTGPHPPAHVSTCGDYATRTSNDGKTYHFNNTVAWPVQVSRYDATTNTNIPVLGSGAQGFCIDGTVATTCKTNLTDVFVTSTGKFFFLDNGLVRVIDDSGNVQTLYGQTKTFGDYGLAQDARFNYVANIDHGMGDDVIVYDGSEKVIREIRPNETVSQVLRIAGNGQTTGIDFGVQASMQTLNGASWNQPGTLATDPTNGNVYFACTWGKVCKLDRTSGLWEIYAGNGDTGTHWTTPGDFGRNDVVLGGYTPAILGNFSGRFITGSYEWSGLTNMNSGLREFNTTTNITSFLAGKVELDGASGCPDGDGNMCNLSAARSDGRAVTYHTGIGAWLYEQGNTLRTLQPTVPNGTIGTFTTMGEGVSSMVWNGTILYYCSDDGLLRKLDFGSMITTNLPFPSNAIKCYGQNILYKNASGGKPARLVFPFRQNGLTGIGEYFSP